MTKTNGLLNQHVRITLSTDTLMKINCTACSHSAARHNTDDDEGCNVELPDGKICECLCMCRHIVAQYVTQLAGKSATAENTYESGIPIAVKLQELETALQNKEHALGELIAIRDKRQQTLRIAQAVHLEHERLLALNLDTEEHSDGLVFAYACTHKGCGVRVTIVTGGVTHSVEHQNLLVVYSGEAGSSAQWTVTLGDVNAD